MKLNKAITILFFILVVVNAADVITTMIGMQLGAAESNHAMIILMVKMGIVEALLLKFFSILILGFIGVWIQPQSRIHPLFFIGVFLFGIGYLLPIVINNLSVIWSLIG